VGSQGSGQVVRRAVMCTPLVYRRTTCIEGRMERPTFVPLVRAVSILSGVWCCIVLLTRGMRGALHRISGPLRTARDGGRGFHSLQRYHRRCWEWQGIPGQDERKRSTRVMPPGGWDARPSATSVGNCRLGSLSTGSLVGRPGYEDGLMYSQARVMPGNAGDSPACVIERSEK